MVFYTITEVSDDEKAKLPKEPSQLASDHNKGCKPLMPLKANEPNSDEQRQRIGENSSRGCSIYFWWWVSVKMGDFNVRALLDSGAARIVLGPIGSQMASVCGQRILSYEGEAIVADGRTILVLGSVELPFEILGSCQKLKALIMEKLDAACLLGIDGIRAFGSAS